MAIKYGLRRGSQKSHPAHQSTSNGHLPGRRRNGQVNGYTDRQLQNPNEKFKGMSEEELWKSYGRKPTEQLRNHLMEKYLHIVRYNAERVHSRLPDEVDIEDLMSAGIFGLMDAIDAYDLGRQVKFQTYAAPRIRGAILDELRHMDWVPRLVRHRESQINKARQSLEQKLGRPPSEEEIQEKLGVDSGEYLKIRRDSRPVRKTSLDKRVVGKDYQEIEIEGNFIDRSSEGPLREIQRKDLQDLVTKGLSRAERLVVVLYYYEGMTMREIGATLDLSESRVSQMHTSILQRLKAQMQHRAREFQED